MRLIDAEAFEKQVIAMGIKNGYLPEKNQCHVRVDK